MPGSSSTDDIILVALDGSPAARTAARVAIQIANRQNLGVYGLYVIDSSIVYDIYATYGHELQTSRRAGSRSELVTWFEEQGNRALGWLEDRCRDINIPCRTNLLVGGIQELVLAKAAQVKLLALGRQGQGHNADRTHLGRNFLAIAHRAHVPLLVGSGEWRTVERFLLVYDGSERARTALAWAVQLQQAFRGQVVVAVVQAGSHTSQTRLSAIQGHLDTSGLADYDLVVDEEGRPASDIIGLAKQRRADLIMIAGYHHPQIIESLIGTPLDNVLRNTELPMLLT